MIFVLGERIGVGRTSEVFAYGADSVIKIPRAGVPEDWPDYEANVCRAVYEAGLPAPEVRDTVKIDGRSAVVFERIDGPSMWQQMLDRPSQIEPLALELAGIQRTVHAAGVLAELPDFVDRLLLRIRNAHDLPEADRVEASDRVATLPRGAAVLHGDLHPGNVLMGTSGPIVIDWFDAAIGHPVADVIRSTLLMRSRGVVAGHLPGASPHILDRLHSAYVAAFSTELGSQALELRSWQAVVAAGRLAEGAEVDEQHLNDLWALRNAAAPPSTLIRF